LTEGDKMDELRQTAARRIRRWIEVAELASQEQNPAKLLALLQELNTLLAREKWLGVSLADVPASDDSEAENHKWLRK
jgi:hypothetical protein